MHIAREKRMQADEMRQILQAFLNNCPGCYKVYVGKVIHVS